VVFALKRIVFLSRYSPTTKGLKRAKPLIYSGIDSRGRIRSERNREILPNETAARVEVSGVENNMPIFMPISVKRVTIRHNTRIVGEIFANMSTLKILIETRIIRKSCSISNRKVVRKFAKRNTPSLVGVIIFLKKAGDFFSIITIVWAKRRVTSMTTRAIRPGNI
jgi:hypothetical protein